MNWISVKDKLPEEKVEVLVWEHAEYADLPFIGWIWDGHWYVDTTWVGIDGDACFEYHLEQKDVSFWMDLPKKPQ